MHKYNDNILAEVGLACMSSSVASVLIDMCTISSQLTQVTIMICRVSFPLHFMETINGCFVRAHLLYAATSCSCTKTLYLLICIVYCISYG